MHSIEQRDGCIRVRHWFPRALQNSVCVRSHVSARSSLCVFSMNNQQQQQQRRPTGIEQMSHYTGTKTAPTLSNSRRISDDAIRGRRTWQIAKELATCWLRSLPWRSLALTSRRTRARMCASERPTEARANTLQSRIAKIDSVAVVVVVVFCRLIANRSAPSGSRDK